jgi:cysteine desulfurase
VTLATGKNQFITSNLDEAPAILATSRLEQLGCIEKLVETNSQGFITAAAIADALSPRTALVSLSWANGLTGVIQPLTEIAALCQERGILLHLEASHVLGKLFFELEDVGADFITFNGDQLHGPRGTGGLYIKQGVKCSPFIIGGADQANLRAGSLNVAGLVGLATAAIEALDSRDFVCTEIARLRDKLENGILKEIPQAIIFFKDQDRLPHCTTIGFPGVSNEALLFHLNRKGLCASIGGGTFQQVALLLTACGFKEELAYNAVAFSLSRYTSEEEIDRAVVVIVESVKSLLRIADQIIKKETTGINT